MSKRNAILLAVAIALVLVAVLTDFGRNLPFRGSMRPDELPSRRPDRLDAKLLKQFADKPINEIIDSLSESEPEPEKSTADSLLDILPNAPIPFPDDSTPGDPAALKRFVDSVSSGANGKPTPVDRWRFNLAATALNIAETDRPETLRMAATPSTATENFPVSMKRVSEDLKGPIAVGNFDGKDGVELVSNGGAQLSTVAEDGTMTPLDSLSGVTGGNGVYPADYDGDGDLDLYITRPGRLPNSLLQNDGTGQFADVTSELGLLVFSDSTSAAWIDFDNDGFLDLLLGSRDHPLELYRQSEGGTFQPVAWDLALWIPHSVTGIEVADINTDGLPDFFVSVANAKDRLFLTTPAEEWNNWRFADVTGASKLRGSKNGAVAKFFDFDNDGDQDLLLGDRADSGESLKVESMLAGPEKIEAAAPEDEEGAAPEAVPLRLYRNRGDGIFDDVSESIEFAGVQDVQAIGIADIDSDGFEDILVGSDQLTPNLTFWNRQGLEFRDVTVSSGLSYLDQPTSYCSADLNGDGNLDLLISNGRGGARWLSSEAVGTGWLTVQLEGNRPGTRVELLVRDQDWVLQKVNRVAQAGSQITFGLGDAKTVESIEVFAPDLQEPVARLEKQAPNQSVMIHIPKAPRKRAIVPVEERAGS